MTSTGEPLPHLTSRKADPDDEPFLRDMLYFALFVPAGAAPPDRAVEAVHNSPRFSGLLAAFGFGLLLFVNAATR